MNEERSSRFHRLKRRAAVLALLLDAALLIALLASNASIALRDVAVDIAAPLGRGTLAISTAAAACAGLLWLLHEILGVPLAFYRGFVLERRYGLSTETRTGWFKDHLKAASVGLVFGALAAAFMYVALRLWPATWWMITAGAFTIVTVLLANLAPVVILPMFYRFKPIDNESLRARLVALAARHGIRAIGVYEWGLGDRTRRANAALVGLGRTRRILLSDTLLNAYSEDEIEVILAHELAHHVHRDIWKGLVFESAVLVGSFYLTHRLLLALGPALGLTAPHDVAGLPLILLAGGAVSIAMVPIANALSRRNERRADRLALRLTQRPAAFVTAMKRLGAQNLAEEHPSRLVRVLFYTHPPLEERIAAAEAFSTARRQ